METSSSWPAPAGIVPNRYEASHGNTSASALCTEGADSEDEWSQEIEVSVKRSHQVCLDSDESSEDTDMGSGDESDASEGGEWVAETGPARATDAAYATLTISTIAQTSTDRLSCAEPQQSPRSDRLAPPGNAMVR